VARAPNEEDGRATDVFLTSDGAKLVKRLRVQGQQALTPIIEQLSASDQQLLQDLLLRMLGSREG
jgi:DNA-binding MarR family transcriptional regulator